MKISRVLPRIFICRILFYRFWSPRIWDFPIWSASLQIGAHSGVINRIYHWHVPSHVHISRKCSTVQAFAVVTAFCILLPLDFVDTVSVEHSSGSPSRMCTVSSSYLTRSKPAYHRPTLEAQHRGAACSGQLPEVHRCRYDILVYQSWTQHPHPQTSPLFSSS